MKYALLVLIAFTFSSKSAAQLYYPPNGGNTWATTSTASLGWCSDSINKLYDYLENTHSKAFILLKDGKIVLEKYFGTFTVDSLWVWNSAAKTLTGFAIGIAQEEGYLSISDTSSDYLGTGWTSLTPQQEEKITIRHQLTMTTGLNDAVSDPYCTDPVCLQYLADAGSRWAYHNGPYTLLDGVIETATGMSLNSWVTQKIKNPIGMTGLYYPVGYNNLFVSTARSMARFGLLLQSQGIWNGNPVLDDPGYFQDMTHSSQAMNPAYGYLTWINGENFYMVPGSQFQIPGSAIPNAPDDLFAAIGKDGQLINVAPAAGIVLIRMGNDDGNSLVSSQYNDTIWQYINRLGCPLQLNESEMAHLTINPNPSTEQTTITGWKPEDDILLYNHLGKPVAVSCINGTIKTGHLAPGMYLLSVHRSDSHKILRLLVN